MPTPPGNAVAAEEVHQGDFGLLVSMTTDARHHLRAFGFSEDIGHYIDQLVKCLAIEKLSNCDCGNKPLGNNLHILQNKIPDDLYSNLIIYNKLAYVPAKHDFTVKNRSHRFTCIEVIFIIFISLKLKDKIIEISEKAREYSESD